MNFVAIAVGMAIAGIILLVILPAAIVVIIAVCLCNRRSRRYETVVSVTPRTALTPATAVYTHTGYGVYRAS